MYVVAAANAARPAALDPRFNNPRKRACYARCYEAPKPVPVRRFLFENESE